MALAPGTGAEPAAKSTRFGSSAPGRDRDGLAASGVDIQEWIFGSQPFPSSHQRRLEGLYGSNVLTKVRSRLPNQPERLFAREGPNFHY